MVFRYMPLVVLAAFVAALPCFAGDGEQEAVGVSARRACSDTPSVDWEVSVDASRLHGDNFDKVKVEVSDADGRCLVSEWHPVEPAIRSGKHTLRGSTRIPALYAQKDKLCTVTLYGRGESVSATGLVGSASMQSSNWALNEAACTNVRSYEPVCPSPKVKSARSKHVKKDSGDPTINSRLYISNHGVGLGTSIVWDSDPYVHWGIGCGVPIYRWHDSRHHHRIRPYGWIGSSTRCRPRSRWDSHFRTGLSIVWQFD